MVANGTTYDAYDGLDFHNIYDYKEDKFIKILPTNSSMKLNASVQIGAFPVPFHLYSESDHKKMKECDEYIKLRYFGGIRDTCVYSVVVFKQGNDWSIDIERQQRIKHEDRFFFNFAFYLQVPTE